MTRTFTTCGHRGEQVVADILQGDFHGGPGGEQAVQWCRCCGAYQVVLDPFGERRELGWREPEGPVGGDNAPTRLLRECRAARGLSQEALARLAECSISLIRQLEGGYQPESSQALPRIAEALGCSVVQLFPTFAKALEYKAIDRAADQVQRTRY